MKTTKEIIEKSQCECDGWEESSFANVQWVRVEDLKKFVNEYQKLYDNNEIGFDEFNDDLNNALTSNSTNAKTNKG